MKFEIVEFYPKKDGEKTSPLTLGTMHVYFIDIQMDLRGINVRQMGRKMMFSIPGFRALDDGKTVFCPFVDFTDRSIKKQLIDFLQTKGIQYIKKNFPEVIHERKKEKNTGIRNHNTASGN